MICHHHQMPCQLAWKIMNSVHPVVSNSIYEKKKKKPRFHPHTKIPNCTRTQKFQTAPAHKNPILYPHTKPQIAPAHKTPDRTHPQNRLHPATNTPMRRTDLSSPVSEALRPTELPRLTIRRITSRRISCLPSSLSSVSFLFSANTTKGNTLIRCQYYENW